MSKLAFNIDEPFEHLPHAPIVEAVIDIRSRAAVVLEETALRAQLETRLSGYQFLDSIQNIQIQHQVNFQNGSPVNQEIQLGWKGVRFQSSDKKQIVQFNRDGFVFSRLEPYENWEQLHKEGLRLWAIYAELTQPIEVGRIGLRYINRIQLPPDELRFEEYLEAAPTPPKGLEVPFYGFLHQDTLAVPDHPYAINVIRTIQPMVPGTQGVSLILDIDVYTIQGFELDEQVFNQRLPEMRWLKNKVFFGGITPKALSLFR